jgi:hypothetical protein
MKRSRAFRLLQASSKDDLWNIMQAISLHYAAFRTMPRP